jgi:predicted transcriptional regulator
VPKAAVFSMKLEADLRDAFLAEAEAAHRPASQVVRELMREFITRQRGERERDAFLQRKVDAARASIRDGAGRSHDDVEADFAARRTRLSGGA